MAPCFAAPLLAGILGCFLGHVAMGRPPQRAAVPPRDDQEREQDGGWDEPEWYEPQPEPVADPYHQWNTGGDGPSHGQDLGMGQWSPSWTWSSWGDYTNTPWYTAPNQGWNQHHDWSAATPGTSSMWWGESWSANHHDHGGSHQQPPGRAAHEQWGRDAPVWHGQQAELRPPVRLRPAQDVHRARGDQQWDDPGLRSRQQQWREEQRPRRGQDPGQPPAGEAEHSDESRGHYLWVSGWGRGAPLLPPDRRAPGFYRGGYWFDRPRNDWEERWQRGGGGETRTQRREGRQAQWFDGSFRPAAFRRAQEQHSGGVIPDPSMRDHFRELLRQADAPLRGRGWGGVQHDEARGDQSAPGTTHQVQSQTATGTWTSPRWTAAEWNAWSIEMTRRRCRDTDADGAESNLDWSGAGLPDLQSFVAALSSGMQDTCSSTTTTMLQGMSTSTSLPSSQSSSTSSSTTLNGVDTIQTDDDTTVLMQTRATGSGDPPANPPEEDDEPGERGDATDAGDNNTNPEEPAEPEVPFQLTADERDELIELGWDAGVVEDLREFLAYLEDVRDRAGVEAVAWALGQWAHSLILSETTLDLVHDILFRRVGGVNELRPDDVGMRGRLCVGFAGFQKVLGSFHLKIVQRLMQDVWLEAKDVGDPPYLPPTGMMIAANTNTAAIALDTARARARAMVTRARNQRGMQEPPSGRGRSGVDEAAEDARASHEPPPGRTDYDNNGNGGDDTGEEEDDAALMQLTPTEESLLHDLGVCDELRARLRELLRGLELQEQRDVGAEYRWGVQQLLHSSFEATSVVQGVLRILRDRVQPSGVMCSFPCQRVPPLGPLRSRVVAWMSEYRHLVVQAFDREIEASLRELTGCPPGSTNPFGPFPDVGVGWNRATREAPRGSRSRSRGRDVRREEPPAAGSEGGGHGGGELRRDPPAPAARANLEAQQALPVQPALPVHRGEQVDHDLPQGALPVQHADEGVADMVPGGEQLESRDGCTSSQNGAPPPGHEDVGEQLPPTLETAEPALPAPPADGCATTSSSNSPGRPPSSELALSEGVTTEP
ncbi:unnamed protein product [Symbiodinium sp. CCMP2592]|nr:unnamed protein product [Symbiodinium sp. CCMP2592]